MFRSVQSLFYTVMAAFAPPCEQANIGRRGAAHGQTPPAGA